MNNPDRPQFDLAMGRFAVAEVDPLPLSGSVPTLTPFLGFPFTGTVATFAPAADPRSLSASIDWGDGTVTAGAVGVEGDHLAVAGTHTYRTLGVIPVSVTLTDHLVRSVASGPALVAAGTLTGRPRELRPVSDQPFRAVVATFTDTNPGARPGDYTAVIDTDGAHFTGTVTAAGNAGLVFDAAKGVYYALGNSTTLGVTALFQIAPQGGTVTKIRDLGADFHGLALDDRGALYSIQTTKSGQSSLYRLPAGQAPEFVAFLGSGFTGGLTYDPQDRRLYAVAADAQGNSMLSRVGPAGAEAVVALGPLDFAGITFDASSGVFYTVALDTAAGYGLYRLQVGATTPLTRVFALGDSVTGGLAFDALGGKLFGISTMPNGSADFVTVLSNHLPALRHEFAVGASFTDGWDVIAAHTFRGTGRDLPVKVVVAGGAGGEATITSHALIATPQPAPLDPQPALLAFPGLTTRTQTVAVFRVPGGADTASGAYTASIDWNDGSAPDVGAVIVSGERVEVRGSHTYALDGDYHPRVVVTDRFGNAAAASGLITVVPDVSSQVAAVNLGGPIYAGLNRYTFRYVLTNVTTLDVRGPLYQIGRAHV